MLRRKKKSLTKIINIFGGPGIGKSGIAAGLYSKMKANHMNVELVTEVAKDYVWEDRINVLTSDQLIIFAEQHRRIDRLRGQVDYVVTDCPILLCIPYIPKGSYTLLEPLMAETAQSFENINIILNRAEGTHKDEGRYHDLGESIEKDEEILAIVDKYDPNYFKTPVDENTVETLYNLLNFSF